MQSIHLPACEILYKPQKLVVTCVADSSRVLVPFQKSLSDYFSKTFPTDLHPSNFSTNTLKLLMQLSGLEVVFANRYFDSDVLLVIGKKIDHQVEPKFFDDQKQVVDFKKEWALASEFFGKFAKPFSVIYFYPKISQNIFADIKLNAALLNRSSEPILLKNSRTLSL